MTATATSGGTPPCTPDPEGWEWASDRSLADLAAYGADPYAPLWLRQAYAWLHARLDDARRAELASPLDVAPAGPPPGWFPVLGADGLGGGRLCFLTLAFEPTATPTRDGDTERAIAGAATWVASSVRLLRHDTDYPAAALHPIHLAGGPSAGLAAFVLAAIRVLGLESDGRLAATGCWSQTERGPRLASVSSETLQIKLELAARWGYRTVLVVDGQDGADQCPAGVEVVTIPSDPGQALLAIVRRLDPGGRQLAETLATYDLSVVRRKTTDRSVSAVLAATQPLVEAGTPTLVRHLAHDIRSRVFLQTGDTVRAAEELANADAHPAPPLEVPDGWLAPYLRWHQSAQRTIVAIDQGFLSDDDPPHAHLDEAITRLDRPLGLAEHLSLFYMRNARARRLDYLGRLRRDRDLLERAWADYTYFHEHWDALVAYDAELGMEDGGLRRQHNQVSDVVAAWRDLTGELPDWPHLDTLWPESVPDLAVEDAPDPRFDLPVWLRWRAIRGPQPSADDVERSLSTVGDGPDPIRHPLYLIPETILRYRLGTDDQRERAASQLRRAESLDADPGSILSVLGLRTAALLAPYGIDFEAASPTPGTALARLADDLRADPDTLVARCPY